MDDLRRNIDEKISKIMNMQKNIKSENQLLIKENERLMERFEEKDQELKKLKHKYNLLKLAKNFEASESEKGDASKKINNIVREINKCIALLNS
ncbi:MAG: hypothetical protein K9H62_16215 [Bacteroidales bacterium]|nr:hypothetical protein [Bacteroidales bacterium]